MSLKERVLHAFGFHDKLVPTQSIKEFYHAATGQWTPAARAYECSTCGRRKFY